MNKYDLITRYLYSHCVEKLWFKELRKVVAPNHSVLEIGSGSGRGLQNQDYPMCGKIVGVDLDPRVTVNPFLNEAFHMDVESFFKINTQRFDVIYSHMVAEHIEDGESFVKMQVDRLNDNGVILHSTVSKFYVSSILNLWVPNTVKNFLIKHLGSGRDSEDIFPAFYNLNDSNAIRRIAEKHNLQFKVIRQDEPPGYVRKSLTLMIFYWIVSTPLKMLLPALKPTFIFVLRKNNG